MRVKVKGPSGTKILNLPDDATIRSLFDEITSWTGIARFSLKYGAPMSMKSLDHGRFGESARALGIHGETLTIVPEEDVRPPASTTGTASMSAASTASTSSSSRAQADSSSHDRERPEDIAIPWPEREGTVVLRVMPSDNSCLFTAFGGALPRQVPAQQLRRMMAEFILTHPDVYSEAVLGCSRDSYCMSIQNPDRWGGGIELSILSNIFDIQICTYDVQAQKMIQFGELKKDRCILVFSGIHYDRVAFSYSEYPHRQTLLPPEMDRTVWPTEDDEILAKTQALVRKLFDAHYFTDTEGLILRCDVPGCEWIGSGQVAGRQHAEKTGHVQLSEVEDTQDDNVVKRCEAFGCEFIGQGGRATRRHILDTGHERFSTIPDI